MMKLIFGKRAVRNPIARRAWIGGFNLLPHRQRDARRARRRLLIECLCAVLAGCSAVTAWAGWQVFERAQLDSERRVAEQALARLAPPLAEYRRLVLAQADERKRAALGEQLSEPLTRLLGLFDALSREPSAGVVLRQLRQTDHDVELRASAKDHIASSGWLEQLSSVRGVRTVDVIQLQRAPRASGRDAAIGERALEFAARLRWYGVAAKPGRAASSGTDGKRGGK
jgi:hypothetical protein